MSNHACELDTHHRLQCISLVFVFVCVCVCVWLNRLRAEKESLQKAENEQQVVLEKLGQSMG
jgi:hypothetical protein